MDQRTSEQRRRNMQAVKNKDSQIERALRLALYRKGYRYRKNYSKVFGCPDIVFVREKIAIFCDSEFWHGHDWEHRKADFKTKQEFWIPKIERNIERDKQVAKHLKKEGYCVLRYWGKQIKKDIDAIIADVEKVILSRRSKKKYSEK